MIKPQKPNNENTRLRILQSITILDTPQEERFDRLTRLAKRMFDVPIALVSLVDSDRQWYKSAIGLDVQGESQDIGFCGYTILGSEIFVIPDMTKDDRFSSSPLVTQHPRLRFYAGCPLRYLDGTNLGALCVMDHKPRSFPEDDMTALRDLAAIVEREMMALQLATEDDLTKTANRRGFTALAQNSLCLCRRENIPVSLVFFDLDKFKRINDTFGHAEGDEVLKVFAQLLKREVRESDIIGRLGGDEFVALLTHSTPQDSKKTVARIRHAIDAHNLTNNKQYDISFSEGIVSVSQDQPSSIETLLKDADALMYRMKQDRTVTTS